MQNIDSFLARLGHQRGEGQPIAEPIAVANAYSFESIDAYDGVETGRQEGYTYSRDGSPNSDVLEHAVAAMEGAEVGVAVNSGVAAIACIITSLLPSPGHVVVAKDAFGGTRRLLLEVYEPAGYEVVFVDFDKLDDLASACDRATGGRLVVLCESVSNPLLRTLDLQAIADITHARSGTFVVDNTFATPLLCQPISYGADVVLHSASKYLSGHADVVGGVVVGRKDVMARTKSLAILNGSRMDPFTSWLTTRGMKSLGLRFEKARSNASALADFLRSCEGVDSVNYPVVPYKSRFTVQAFGGCAVVSFVLLGGRERSGRVVRNLRGIKFVGSLGDVATSVSYPVVTSHRTVAEEERADIGIVEGLIRVSVGIEDPGDLIDEFRTAVAASHGDGPI